MNAADEMWIRRVVRDELIECGIQIRVPGSDVESAGDDVASSAYSGLFSTEAWRKLREYVLALDRFAEDGYPSS